MKKNGLAAGKGVKVCQTKEDALNFMKELANIFDFDTILFEEFIDGPELSIHALSDGKTHKLMLPIQDYKALYVGGPNTGGMGAVAPINTGSLLSDIDNMIIKPMIKEMSDSEWPFIGCFYPGFKITPTGAIVLEINVRFGDPETQSLMMLLKTDLLDIIEACIEGRLTDIGIKWLEGFAVCVILASKGYPGEYQTGFPIRGIKKAEEISGVKVFHAGTSYDIIKGLETNGGRVLGVTAKATTLQEAIKLVYEAVNKIDFEGKTYRKDIGQVFSLFQYLIFDSDGLRKPHCSASRLSKAGACPAVCKAHAKSGC